MTKQKKTTSDDSSYNKIEYHVADGIVEARNQGDNTNLKNSNVKKKS